MERMNFIGLMKINETLEFDANDVHRGYEDQTASLNTGD
ncbi:hypothetical protein J2Z37_004433 [Ammoniphilus resinae]|uniref:Uncharacterized protein n=1 Tax=Ammoniphilus resinae TaxID=861532 RepID=A0ABS4GVW6_9BACL|nr:hypothetical protein [Ammoniphilus resinae]